MNLLERQSYIERNGSSYAYLTDTEKDIEQEIKQTDIDDSEMMELLAQIVYEDIIRDAKFRDNKNHQDFAYTRQIDDIRKLGKDHELQVNIITPLHPDFELIDTLKARTAGTNAMYVLLPKDTDFLGELRLFKQTEKYVRLNSSSTEDDRAAIIREKSTKNNNRRKDIQNVLTDALGKSQIFINGTEVKPAGDPRTRITSGFLNLVDTCYISHIPQELTDKDIPTYLQKGGLDDWMSAYEKAVLDYVQKEKSLGQNVLLPKLTDRFSKRPYGWTQVATACMVAALYAKGKIEMVDGNGQLTDKEVSEVLGKTKNQDKVQITVVADYSPT